MSNLSILQQNIANSMSPLGAKVFLQACDRLSGDHFHYEAEAFAREHETLAGSISVLLPMASRAHDLEYVPEGLEKFVLDRHWHSRFPGN